MGSGLWEIVEMAIDWHRPEYEREKDRWQLVDDMVSERNLAKHIPDLDTLKGLEILRNEEGEVTYRANADTRRNDEFKSRASFFGASGQTLESLIGTAFEKDPQITLPTGLEYLLANVDGSGIDMWQQMQETTGETLKKARAGLYVTMPETDGAVSIADQEAMRAVATIALIDAKRIINWWTETDGADTYLAGVVFTDTREEIENYEVKEIDICRELAIDEEGYFFDRAWVKGDGGFEGEDPIYPTDSSGNRLTRIPFMFVGARRNHWDIQKPPMLSLARKNRDHYRNSAINEEGIWFSGHIQPVADELDPEVWEQITGEMKIGGGHMMVAKGFKFEVAEPNTAARQGMIDKAEEMAALGAKMLQPGGVAKTAQQDAGEQRLQHSVLSLVSVNVEDAYQWAAERVQEFMGVAGEIEVKLNRSFMEPMVTAEKMREMRENLLSGVIGPEEMFMALQRSGDIKADKTFDEYSEELGMRGVTGSSDDIDDNVVDFESALIEGLTGGR